MSDAMNRMLTIAMEPQLVNFFSEAQRRNFERGQAQGRAEGRAEARAEGQAKGQAKGRAESLLTILVRRGLTLSATQRNRILGCTDLAMLKRWLDRSLSVSSVAELFAPPAKRSRTPKRRGRPVVANRRLRRR